MVENRVDDELLCNPAIPSSYVGTPLVAASAFESEGFRRRCFHERTADRVKKAFRPRKILASAGHTRD